jgi:hypothetical protein
MVFSYQFNSKPGEPALLTWVHVEAPDGKTAFLLACQKFVEKRYEVKLTDSKESQ